VWDGKMTTMQKKRFRTCKNWVALSVARLV
jgi:hypothetical protein